MKELIKGRALKLACAIALPLILGVQTAFALTNTPLTLPNPVGVSTFPQVIANITQFLVYIAIPLTAIMVLVGGFQMITAGGDPEKFSKGRKTLMYAAIGFAIVLLASGIAAIIQNFLGSSS